MNVAELFGILGGASATVSALAAARSAKVAGAAFRPFVISSGISHSSNSSQLTTTLSNAGPGMAIDVRFRVGRSMWSSPLDALGSGAEVPRAATDVSLEARWKQPNAQQVVQNEIQAAEIIVEFTGLDGTRWRTVKHGGRGERPELQRLTPRWIYFWRKL